ncbi:tyrosine--tRNA ligase [Methanobacterium formicicum]|jgi:tyrosyl-tRNA synthetase|uniref:Tyrosine--tRNA ligase n=1 Tax=Methanobacterium formicicum TaxID=2162 RepID=A0A843AV73_METFO|nr:tyrosine--tRNA ligase [Methanobacterium formicicum]MBF4475433.1 tyrosine--tRNA ligase [Methanobacterium formicicum]
MNKNSVLSTIEQGTLEVITPEELEAKLEKDEKTAYIGYEPSGKVHLGHAITVKKMIDLQKAGFRIKILLADLHAYLNGKGSLEEIEEIAEYNKRCFRALGLSEDTEFILGSSFQTREDYTMNVYQLALSTTLTRARRSMAQITRSAEDHQVAEVIYPLMQVVDMLFLEVDLAVGGMEQRKIHMLARDNLPKLGFQSPVCIHTPLLHGTDGSDKMSSSKENFIAIDDEPAMIREKIKKSYCPAGEVEGNPILEIAHHFIFSEMDTLLIERPEKFGGNLELSQEELLKMYGAGDLHPLDLKNGVAECLIQVLEPVRNYLQI